MNYFIVRKMIHGQMVDVKVYPKKEYKSLNHVKPRTRNGGKC